MNDGIEQQRLGDAWWRLNNLYYIKDKAGEKIRFRPNWAQKMLYEDMWYLNIILKARQLGMTTFIQIFMLDRCLFNDNINAGVVAHNREDAEAFFSDKIKFAYDHLPEDLKKLRRNTSDTKNLLELSNGSKIRVGTSLRSGTYQYAHISEFGKMCAKYPDKAEEVVSGTLNTVAPGQFIWIESTAEGPYGRFFDMCQTAEKLDALIESSNGDLTPLDYKFFFLPWWQHPDYMLDMKVEIPPKSEVYFRELRNEHGIELTEVQKYWYVKKEAEQGELMKQEYPSTPAEAFERTTEVSILGKVLRAARKAGRITSLPIVRGVPVNTFWDLGRDDYTAIWFHQMVKDWHHFIFYFQDRLEDLVYYADTLKELKKEYGWIYGKHYLPHDVDVTDLSSRGGLSRRQILQTAGVNPIIVVPKIRVLNDGIEQLRNKFPEAKFDIEACAKGLEGLAGYEWQWDDINKIARKTPRPGWANHPAVSLRQWSQAYRGSEYGFMQQQSRFASGENPRNYARHRHGRDIRSVTNPSLDHVK